MPVERFATVSGAMFRKEENRLTERAIRWKLVFDTQPDREKVQEALDAALKQYPFMAMSMEPGESCLWYVPNPSPVRVCDILPERLGGGETEGHCMALAHRGGSLELAVYHGLTDGAGVGWFMEALVRALFGEDGELLAKGRPLRALDPLETCAGIPAEAALKPVMPEAFFAFPEAEHPSGKAQFQAAFSRQALRDFCAAYGCSVTAAMIFMLCEAVQRVHPENGKTLCARCPVNSRSILGIPDTFMNASFPQVAACVDPAAAGRADAAEAAASLTEQIRTQTTRERVAAFNGQIAAVLRKTPAAGSDAVMKVFRAPILFSNLGSFFPEKTVGHVMNSYFSGYGAVPFSAYMTTVGNRCFLSIAQGFGGRAYMDALSAVMTGHGIAARITENSGEQRSI